MITFTLLVLLLAIIGLIVAINLGLVFIVFGDCIVCVLLIIVLLTRKKRRNKNGNSDGDNSGNVRSLDD